MKPVYSEPPAKGGFPFQGKNSQQLIMEPIFLTDKTFSAVSRLGEVFGVSNTECLERLLARFVFEPMSYDPGEIIAEEVEQIVCKSRSQATALTKRLEAFAGSSDRPVRASVVQDDYGWGVKAASRLSTAIHE